MRELSKTFDIRGLVPVALILCVYLSASARVAVADEEMNRKAIEYAYSIFAP